MVFCRIAGKGSPPARWGRAPGSGLVLVLNSNGILKQEHTNGMLEHERRATSYERRVQRRVTSDEQREGSSFSAAN
jgi:hypothetical protein